MVSLEWLRSLLLILTFSLSHHFRVPFVICIAVVFSFCIVDLIYVDHTHLSQLQVAHLNLLLFLSLSLHLLDGWSVFDFLLLFNVIIELSFFDFDALSFAVQLRGCEEASSWFNSAIIRAHL